MPLRLDPERLRTRRDARIARPEALRLNRGCVSRSHASRTRHSTAGGIRRRKEIIG
jgi:hypothetical protein